MTAFSKLPPACRRLWAKSGEGSGHGLLAHMLDVAAVAASILEREAESTRHWAAQNFGVSNDSVIGWISALAGLHDFGKAITGFQTKWPEGRQAGEAVGLPFMPRNLEPSDHGAATYALLRRLLCEKVGNPGWSNAVLQAISAHHGYNYLPNEVERARPAYEPAPWDNARRELFSAYWQVVTPAGEPDRDELLLPAVEWLAGLTSIADWIGSNVEWFPPGERADELAEHFLRAKELAGFALDAIRWPVFQPLLESQADTDTLICRIVGQAGIEARPLQATADALLIDAEGPALVIVEAPMGEGKTELAMLAHLRLQRINQHRGLYIALPTQATGNAMFDRTLGFLRAFAADIPLDIQLAHGGAVLDERVARLRDVHGEHGDNVGCSAWFSQRRRALISPYGVGTIDQALFATLNVKHHFVRLWGLANRVVVLDEVHAYDTYTSGLIDALLRWLKALHCSVVLMSATLPRKRQVELLRAWGTPVEETPAFAYPRLIIAHGAGIAGDTVSSRPQAPIEVRGVAEPLEVLAAYALAQLSGGGCGAIIVNTVDRAQKLYAMLRDQLPGECRLTLFHARYPADERAQREAQVLEQFGRAGTRPRRALLVATQVAEQSLDIDFDFLISDLAPVDLLLQRAGRLHRHVRERPETHGTPRLTVAGLLSDRFPDLKETAWQYVYDAYILGRTWALATREPLWQLPQDIDRLVQRVYDDEVPLPDDLAEADRRRIDESAYGEYRAQVQQDFLYAVHAAIDIDSEPQHAYADKPRGSEEGEGLGIRNRTRLGDDALSVVPVHVSDEGWRVRYDEAPFDPRQPISDALARSLFARHVKLGNRAVIAELGAAETPPCFAEHPLLRNLKPLLLYESVALAEGMKVRLDRELGLIYEKV